MALAVKRATAPLLLACNVLFASLTAAEVPHLIRYQGQAVDAKGEPLKGPYTLTFRLYDVETGGAPLWEEQQKVTIEGGHFSVLLGSGTLLSPTPLAEMDWSAPRWLGVQVNGEPELAPRQRITSVPLAIRAEEAETLTVPMTTSTITDDANRLVPAGAIILWTGASCPAGYSRISGLDGKFLVSGSTYNPAAGGSPSHSHGGQTGGHALTVAEMPPHTHGLRGHANAGGPGPNWFPNLSDPVYTNTESTGSGQAHSHSIGDASHLPPFATILLCQKD
jgi:hypothetical protein